ncbi:TPA: hypothetical protein DCZ31_03595 [Patescibacteria group bacterium]|nr:hypothetical protein [Candidatus Gracilibacteria bacterium]
MKEFTGFIKSLTVSHFILLIVSGLILILSSLPEIFSANLVKASFSSLLSGTKNSLILSQYSPNLSFHINAQIATAARIQRIQNFFKNQPYFHNHILSKIPSVIQSFSPSLLSHPPNNPPPIKLSAL